MEDHYHLALSPNVGREVALEGARHQYLRNRVCESDAWTDQEQKAWMISFSYPPRRISQFVKSLQMPSVHMHIEQH